MYNKSMNKFLTKTKEFFAGRKYYWISAGIVFALFQILFIVNGDFPYGKNTVLMGDSYTQIGVFFEYLFDVFSGKANLFYTNAIGGGVEIFSTIEYMLLNPFFIFAFFGGKKNVFLMMNISVMFMFIFNAIVFLWFAKKYFKNIKDSILVLLSIMFAFAPCVAANFCFVTWLIYPAITLLLIDKFLKLVNEGKILGFVCIMVWFVCTCFSIGVSANIILVLMFSAYIFLTVSKEEQKAVFSRLLIAYVLSILASVVILFPSILDFLTTGRMGLSLDELFTGAYYNDTLMRFSVMFLDGFMLVLLMYYFIRCDKKVGKNKFYIFALIALTIINLSGQSICLLCGGVYNGFAQRFYFFNDIIIFLVVLELLNSQMVVEQKKENPMTLYKILHIAVCSIYVLCLVWWVVISFTKFGIGIKRPLIEGDIQIVILIIFAIMLVACVLIYLTFKFGLITKKCFNVTVVFMLISTLFVNFISMATNTYASTSFNDVKTMTANLNENSKFRTHRTLFQDYALNSTSMGLKTGSYFSSLLPANVTKSHLRVGYKGTVTAVNSDPGNIVSDALYGYEYIFSGEKFDRPYLEYIAEKDGVYLYKNTFATTGAVFIDDDFAFDENLGLFENLENLKTAVGVSGTLSEDVVPEKVDVSDIDKLYSKFIHKYTYTATKKGILYVNESVPVVDNEDYLKYYNQKFEDKEYYFIEGGLRYSYSDLKMIEAGETVEFYIVAVSDYITEDDKNMKFKFVDYEVAENLCTELQNRQAKIEYNKDGYKILLDGDEQGRLLVFQNNFDGMHYTADGVKISAGNEFGYFATFDVEFGTKLIEAEYRYSGGKLWLAVSLVLILLIVVIAVVYKKTQFKFIQKPMRIAFFVVSCCILFVFVIMALILTFYKNLL